MKARTVVGRGEVSLPCDPGSELRLSVGDKEKRRANLMNGEKTYKRTIWCGRPDHIGSPRHDLDLPRQFYS